MLAALMYDGSFGIVLTLIVFYHHGDHSIIMEPGDLIIRCV